MPLRKEKLNLCTSMVEPYIYIVPHRMSTTIGIFADSFVEQTPLGDTDGHRSAECIPREGIVRSCNNDVGGLMSSNVCSQTSLSLFESGPLHTLLLVSGLSSVFFFQHVKP